MRANTPQLHRLVQGALRAHLVDDPDAPANYSLQVVAPDPAHPGRTPLHFLYENAVTAIRTRSPRRAVEGLLTYLDFYAAAERDDLVVVDALAFVRDGRALLAPHVVRLALKRLERHFNRAGFVLVDMPRATVDVASGDLLVPERRLEVDEAALADLEHLAPEPPRTEATVRPGRYPIACWAFGGGQGEAVAPAKAVHEAAVLARNGHAVGAQRLLDALATVFSRTPATRFGRWDRDTVAALAARTAG